MRVKAPAKTTPDPVTPRLGRMLTVGQAAIYLGLTTSQLRKMIRRGEIQTILHVSGRVMGIYTVHADDWQDGRLRASAEVSDRASRLEDTRRARRREAADVAARRKTSGVNVVRRRGSTVEPKAIARRDDRRETRAVDILMQQLIKELGA